MSFEYAIAITGGIATGKSLVCAMLEKRGYPIISADAIAHAQLEQNKHQLFELFGPSVCDHDTINRQALAKIIFAHAKEREKLQALLHPQIKKEILHQSAKFESQKQHYGIEIPLFYETKQYDIAQVVVVYAPKEMQIQRLQQRNGLLLHEAMQRLEAQIDIEQKRHLGAYVIKNTQDISALEQKVHDFVQWHCFLNALS